MKGKEGGSCAWGGTMGKFWGEGNELESATIQDSQWSQQNNLDQWCTKSNLEQRCPRYKAVSVKECYVLDKRVSGLETEGGGGGEKLNNQRNWRKKEMMSDQGKSSSEYLLLPVSSQTQRQLDM